MAIHGSVGAVYTPDTLTGTSVTGETFSGDDTTVTFNLANEYVKPGSETVTVGGVEQKEGTDYTINYIIGEITFETAPTTGTDNTSVDYDYFTMSSSCGFFSWSVNENADAEENTTFCNTDGNRTYQAGLKDWDGSAEQYWLIDENFHDYVGKEVILVFYVDEDQQYRYEGWGVFTGVSSDVSVDALIEQSIDIQGSGSLEFRQP